MEDKVVLEKISNFYFCFLVNLRISAKINAGMKNNEKVRLIKKWLINAKKKKLFDPVTLNEIEWLLGEVDKLPLNVFEERINKIYTLSGEITEKN